MRHTFFEDCGVMAKSGGAKNSGTAAKMFLLSRICRQKACIML
jgi:hypothetical protein